MTTRKKLSVTLIIVTSALLIVGTISAYIVRFGFVSLNTSSPTDWGVFGDFFSGFLGTLISIINLIVLVRLTNYVSDQDNNTALNQFRFDFYLKLTESIDQFDFTAFKQEELDKLLFATSLIRSYVFLFKNEEQSYRLKADKFKLAVMDIEHQANLSKINPVLNMVKKRNDSEFSVDEKLGQAYLTSKAEFLLLLQQSMLK